MTRFTYEYLQNELQQLLRQGYRPMTCRDYAMNKQDNCLGDGCWVNRVDIDLSLKKADALRELFCELEIQATFFVRLHAPEYNPFSFEGYRILRALLNDGHEIGYHSEVIDQAAIWGENPEDCLHRDVRILSDMIGSPIVGAASHGGMTGLNNLDFWKLRKPADFGLLYEAYDKEPEFNLFDESFYVSDSEWTRWKCYDRGVLKEGDRRSPSEHAADRHPVLYTLLHPDTYFRRHFYE